MFRSEPKRMKFRRSRKKKLRPAAGAESEFHTVLPLRSNGMIDSRRRLRGNTDLFERFGAQNEKKNAAGLLNKKIILIKRHLPSLFIIFPDRRQNRPFSRIYVELDIHSENTRKTSGHSVAVTVPVNQDAAAGLFPPRETENVFALILCETNGAELPGTYIFRPAPADRNPESPFPAEAQKQQQKHHARGCCTRMSP